jgi:uncharacterized membrane protein
MSERTSTRPWEGRRHRDEAGVEFSRILAFSDGVFAIAITLLVLALQVPEDASDLGPRLWDQRNDLLAYAISFAVLSKLWLAHHRFFSGVERFDGTLMGLNLFYLAWVALVPFSSEVLGDYSGASDGVIVYAANMSGVTLTFAAQIVYAYRAELMRTEARGARLRFAGPANFVPAAVFLTSIPVALLSPDAATLIWLLIFFGGSRAGDWIANRRARA